MSYPTGMTAAIPFFCFKGFQNVPNPLFYKALKHILVSSRFIRDENATINLDNEGMIKLKAAGFTVSARRGFNVSRVMMNTLTPMNREALFITQA